MIYDFCSELITNGPKCNFLREEELPLDVASLANQHFLYFFLARCNFWRALFPLFPSPSFFIPHDDSWLGADSFQNFSVMCILKSEELEYVSEKPKLTNWVTSEVIRHKVCVHIAAHAEDAVSHPVATLLDLGDDKHPRVHDGALPPALRPAVHRHQSHRDKYED